MVKYFFSFLLLLLASAAGFLVVVLTPHNSRAAAFVADQGMSARAVAVRLEEKGVIASSLSFRALIKLTGTAGDIKAGEYDLSGRRNQWQVLKYLAEGRVNYHIITVPEGYTVSQIADLLQKSGAGNEAQFRAAARIGNRSRPAVLYAMEGYLFPDTYRIPAGMKEPAIVSMMNRRFNEVTAPLDMVRVSAQRGLTPHDLLTIASLIEKEAAVPDDRRVIASVIYNRLSMGMRLECDATVQYIMPEHKERVLYTDLKIDSPYNTYRNAGLPPGPIANPGLASLKAALQPAKTDYFFYVAGSGGRHVFSRTYQEHLEAISRIRRGAR
ncbi:MAG: endolytic transglycosylase MltG [bacterium]|nr:endolytic transglycosylase MltG [bacterium]MDD3806083.1 endolytic transglycosylase MltG [bacterium]MDD4153243.1 endolytic transglycosylase MltG [bacterium]MDD4557805.1 endolytic transglycosylase MltG [bacterium]